MKYVVYLFAVANRRGKGPGKPEDAADARHEIGIHEYFYNPRFFLLTFSVLSGILSLDVRFTSASLLIDVSLSQSIVLGKNEG